ncbi:hypothetical protein AB2Z78_005721 [Salmonella enterica]
MVAVYSETASCSLSRQQLQVLPEQIILAGSVGTDARFAKLRADQQELTALNNNISTMSMQMADMPEQRAALCGNDHFQCDRIRKLIEFIDDAGEENGHCLKPELHMVKRAVIVTRP